MFDECLTSRALRGPGSRERSAAGRTRYRFCSGGDISSVR